MALTRMASGRYLIGDTVNVAARVEELTKKVGDPLLATGATHERLARTRDELDARGSHHLRGTAAGVDIFAIRPLPAEQVGADALILRGAPSTAAAAREGGADGSGRAGGLVEPNR